MAEYRIIELWTGRQVQAWTRKYKPEPENDLEPKLGPKIKSDLKNYSVIAHIR